MQLSELAYRPIGQIQLRYLNLRRFVSPDNSPVHQEFGEPYMRLVYIVRGRAVFEADGAQFEAGDYSLVYIPRNTEYRSSWLPGSVRELAIMDIDLRDEQDCPIGFGEQAEVLFHDEHGLYAGYFGEIAHMDEDDAPYRWLERMAMALKLCCEIARQRVLQTEGPRSARIYTALAYLEHNYAQDTPVRELARMCALSISAFRKLFLQAKGMTPVDYRNALRIRRAAELLKSGSRVADAARAVGIQDAKYFSKLCKRYTGLSPSQLNRARAEQRP